MGYTLPRLEWDMLESNEIQDCIAAVETLERLHHIFKGLAEVGEKAVAANIERINQILDGRYGPIAPVAARTRSPYPRRST